MTSKTLKIGDKVTVVNNKTKEISEQTVVYVGKSQFRVTGEFARYAFNIVTRRMTSGSVTAFYCSLYEYKEEVKKINNDIERKDLILRIQSVDLNKIDLSKLRKAAKILKA